jgi:hypothetical protein
MASGGWNENWRTGCNFWNALDRNVASISDVTTADCCVTNLGTPCVLTDSSLNAIRCQAVIRSGLTGGLLWRRACVSVRGLLVSAVVCWEEQRLEKLWAPCWAVPAQCAVRGAELYRHRVQCWVLSCTGKVCRVQCWGLSCTGTVCRVQCGVLSCTCTVYSAGC